MEAASGIATSVSLDFEFVLTQWYHVNLVGICGINIEKVL